MCHIFIEMIISGSNSQHSMLSFHKKNIDLQKKNPSNIDNKYVSIFDKSLQFWRLM